MDARRGSPATTVLVALVGAATVLSACTSRSAAPVSSASDGDLAANGTPAADVQPWLAGPVALTDGTGPAFPTVWPRVRVVGSGTSASLAPALALPEGARATGAVEVQVVDMSAGGGFGADGRGEPTVLVWEGTGDRSGVQLPPTEPVLVQGATYAWRARASADAPWLGPWAFSVDTVRAATAPRDETGGAVVNMLSGVPSATWTSPSYAGAVGSISLSATYRPGTAAIPGLPAGWAWSLPGSGFRTLTESDGETSQPTAETSEPAPETSEPAPETSEPAPETSEPAPETSEPAPETSEPAPETSEPAATTAPAAETSAPVAPAGEDLGPRSVLLSTPGSGGVTFVRGATGGSYLPGLSDGSAVQITSGGTLTRQGPGVWLYADPGGVVTRFEGGRAVAEWQNGRPVATFAWDGQGRLTQVTDGVPGGRVIGLTYTGAGDCPSASWGQGFALADGLWCGVTYPDGTSTGVGYIDTGAGAQIALVADPGGVGLGLGWDRAGRLTALRSPSATAAAATASEAFDGTSTMTVLTYDDEGRVATLTSPAGTPAGPRVRRTYGYPVGSDATLVARVTQESVDGKDTTAVPSLLQGDATAVVEATADTWQVLRRTGSDGRSAVATYDEASGTVTRSTAPNGRVTQVAISDSQVVQSSVGPFQGDQSGAMRSDRTVDATIVDPEQGQESRVEQWHGLAATVWPTAVPGASVGVPQWWNRSVTGSGDGLAAGFDASPTGAPGPWSAQATGLWRVPEKGEYAVEVSRSDSARVEFVIDGVRCVNPDGAGRCLIPLSAGDHAVLLTVVVDDPQGAASFAVKAGIGEPRPVPAKAVRPNYNSSTRQHVNDSARGTDLGTQVMTVSQPWSGIPDTVRAAGGLTTAFEYEPLEPAAGRWQRPTLTTTPGGLTLRTDYWGVTDVASDPCTGGSAPQSGLPKQVTRYDGVTVTTVYNAAGLPASVETAAPGGPAERQCTSYDPAGRVVSSSSTGLDGQSAQTTTIARDWVDGRLVTTETTVLGPAAVVGAGETYTTRTVTDLLGQPVRYVDAAGVRTDFAYNYARQLTRRSTWAPGLDPQKDPATVEVLLTYDPATDRLTEVGVGGPEPRVLARMGYEEQGMLSSLSFPGDTRTSIGYDTAGAPDSLDLRAGKVQVRQSRARNEAGRTLSSSLVVTRGGSPVTDLRWRYGYDDAGRLAEARLATQGDTTVSGGRTRSFDYGYGRSPGGCAEGAGADLNRTSGSVDGVGYVSCTNAQGRLQWTTEPALTGRTSGDGGGDAPKAEVGYDALGRVTTVSGVQPLTLAWGAGTTLARSTVGATTTELTTVGGRVVRQTTDGTATTMGYAAPDATMPTLLLDAQGAVVEARVGLPGGALAHLDPTGAVRSIDHADLFGSVLASTGPDGSPVGDAVLSPQYGPFGEPLVADPAPAPPEQYRWMCAARNPSLGGVWDLTLTARPYSPLLGQFLAFDPDIGASTTGYGYGDAQPLDRPDPTGRSSTPSWLKWVTGGVAVVAGVVAGVILGGPEAGRLARGVGWGLIGLGVVAAAAGGVYALKTGDEQAGWASLTTAVGMAIGVFAGYKWASRPQAPLDESTISVVSQPHEQLSLRSQSAIDRQELSEALSQRYSRVNTEQQVDNWFGGRFSI